MAELKAVKRVVCRTPTPDKKGVTRIPKWKFDCIRQAIIDIVSQNPIYFAELTAAVQERLESHELKDMGSLGWHVVSVKLEMEVRGEIQRLPTKGKQVLGLGKIQ